jgi:hypothetical protein
MAQRSILLTIVFLFFSASANSAFEYLWAAEDVGFNHGHVQRISGALVEDPKSETGYSWKNAKFSDIKETNLIPLKKGHGFDVHLLLFKLPSETETIDVAVTHPPMALPSGKVLTTRSTSIPTYNRRGFPETSFAYTLDEDYELVEGDWTLTFSHQGKDLFRVTFTVISQ